MESTDLQSSSLDWQAELKKTAGNYNLKVTWVAIIFNVLFGVTDYFNVEEHWKIFLGVRLAVSFITFSVYFVRKDFKIPSEWVVFVPFLLISFQNAFMWSVMDAEHLQKHTLAYMALFIGAGMLILWKIRYSVIVVALSIPVNVFFFIYNSDLTLEQIMVNGGLLTASVAIFSILLIQTRYNLTKKEIISRIGLAQSNIKLNEQKEIIEENNKSITDSIKYAKRIQEAVLPDNELLKAVFSDHFVHFRPKDIVSGDFYWFARRDKSNTSFIAAVDCTGHGVPGAFMSMIGNTILNEIVHDETLKNPADILFELRTSIIESLQQSGQVDNKEGMDIALCMIEHEQGKLQFAGAYNPLYIIRNNELITAKADRMPIGNFHDRNEKPFTNHVFDIEKGDHFYIFSDGYIDQFGGPDEKKFSSKKFKNLLLEAQEKPLNEQSQLLETTMKDWKGELEQIDDILVIGFEI